MFMFYVYMFSAFVDSVIGPLAITVQVVSALGDDRKSY